jgi:hypothetical protein
MGVAGHGFISELAARISVETRAGSHARRNRQTAKPSVQVPADSVTERGRSVEDFDRDFEDVTDTALRNDELRLRRIRFDLPA